jgi:hypothetical protein
MTCEARRAARLERRLKVNIYTPILFLYVSKGVSKQHHVCALDLLKHNGDLWEQLYCVCVCVGVTRRVPVPCCRPTEAAW